MEKRLKSWQGWLLFGGSMVVVFVLGLCVSALMERRAELASVFNNRKTVIEGIEAGTSLFLIDEDTSATNFMIRDELMQRVVNRDAEPIVPFIDRVEELYHTYGISTVLVAGSSGSYFHKADCIIQMNRYEPFEITESAKQAAAEFPLPKQDIAPSKQPDLPLLHQKPRVHQTESHSPYEQLPCLRQQSHLQKPCHILWFGIIRSHIHKYAVWFFLLFSWHSSV